MAEVDTSSYPKPSLPVSPLDTFGKLQSLQQQKQSIDQQKLDQANQGLTYMTRAMGALGPDATKDQYIQAASTAVKMGLVPAQQLNAFVERAQAAPNSQAFYNEFMTTAADHQQQINYHLGQMTTNSNGQVVTPTMRSPKPGFGERPVGLPVQQQVPPSSAVVDENNQPRMVGVQPPMTAPGTVATPTPLPVQPLQPRPVATTGPTGPTVRTDANRPVSVSERIDAAYPKPTGFAAGTSPMFSEGKQAYAADQINASNRAQSIKPAIQALKLMPGLSTGPGTGQFNDLVAAAKAWGIVDTKAENDPTVLRQEIEKKLAQYVGNSPIANRSDAAQTLAEAGSPNPKKQILPALQNLTRDAIALDRVQILMPNAFKGEKYQDYIKHKGNFPQSVDEKALTLDLMPKEQSAKIVDQMHAKYLKHPNDANVLKFFSTLDLAKKNGFYNQGSE